jgi:hypothetical protein
MVVVLDSHPWNPIHHAWFRFYVNHATEYMGIDGGFEVYAFNHHQHGFPPFIRGDSEGAGNWSWEVSDPARKIVFKQTFTIHLPSHVTVRAGNHVSDHHAHPDNNGLTFHHRLSNLPAARAAALP